VQGGKIAIFEACFEAWGEVYCVQNNKRQSKKVRLPLKKSLLGEQSAIKAKRKNKISTEHH
jgi:hypothetical protein